MWPPGGHNLPKTVILGTPADQKRILRAVPCRPRRDRQVLKRISRFLGEYLRINAIRRMLAIVDVRSSEILGLVCLAVLFAIFEGIGLSLLLPILQYAESGETAIMQGSGFIWTSIARVMDLVGLPETLPVLLALAFIPILLRQVVFYLNAWYGAVVAGRIAVRLRMTALDAMFDADPEYFSRHPVGELAGIIVTQTMNAGLAVLAVLKQLSVVLLMLVYVAILFALSVPLSLVTLGFALLVSWAVRTSIKRTGVFGMQAARISQELAVKIVERFDMMRLVKLRDQTRVESRRVFDLSEGGRILSIKQARLGANIEVTADPLLMLSVFVTLYIGIAELGMTLAQLGLVLFILNRLNAKVKEFNAGRQAISANVAGLLVMKEATDDALAANTIHRGPVRFEGLEHEIALDDVTFAYRDERGRGEADATASMPVLRGVTLTIPAGSLTALVGRSGAGKSTLVELLPRLHDATSGSITFDGIDVKQFDVGTLRRGIGYLTQTAMLFNDTVRENLTYGLGFDASEEQIRHALERAYATFVYRLPKGLETTIGDRGVRLSGGERQRIALARVLLEDASILILDEPTSALDSESESYIQQALHELHGEKTIIVIAHRLATVIQADQLLVIEEGRVTERGTHEELMARAGSYQRLFESQLIAEVRSTGAQGS